MTYCEKRRLILRGVDYVILKTNAGGQQFSM